MNDDLHIDFKKEYVHLFNLPYNLSALITFLICIAFKKDLINIDEDLFWLLLCGMVLIILLVIFIFDNLIKKYLIKKQFSHEQLTKANKIGQYIAKISAIAFFAFLAMQLGFF